MILILSLIFIVFITTVLVLYCFVEKQTKLGYVGGFLGIGMITAQMILFLFDLSSFQIKITSLYTFICSAFWISFSFSWYFLSRILFPSLHQHDISGEFNRTFRIFLSIWLHFKSLLLPGLLVLLLIAAAITKSGISGLFIFPTLLVTLGNVWGLLLLVLYLSHGLISLPKRFWSLANYDNYLNTLYLKFGRIEEQAAVSQKLLKIAVGNIQIASEKVPKCSMLQQILITLKKSTPENVLDKQNFRINIATKGIITGKSLVKLHTELKCAVKDNIAILYKYDSLLREIIYYEDILVSQESGNKRIEFTLKQSKSVLFSSKKDLIYWYYILLVKPCCYRLLSMIFSLASIILIFSETVLFMKLPLNPIPFLSQSFSPLLNQCSSYFFFIYLCACTSFAFSSTSQHARASIFLSCSSYINLLIPLFINYSLLADFKTSKYLLFIKANEINSIENAFYYIPVAIGLLSILSCCKLNRKLLDLIGIENEPCGRGSEVGKSIARREKTRLIWELGARNPSLKNWEMIDMDASSRKGSISQLLV